MAPMEICRYSSNILGRYGYSKVINYLQLDLYSPQKFFRLDIFEDEHEKYGRLVYIGYRTCKTCRRRNSNVKILCRRAIQGTTGKFPWTYFEYQPILQGHLSRT